MKTVLIRPNYKSHIVTPPLGIGYLAAYLKRDGIEVKIIDGLKNKLTKEQILRDVFIEKPDVVGITCLTAFYNEAIVLSNLIKNSNIRTIIGGVHPTFLPYSTLIDSQADFVICGEGEIALTKLIKNNFNNYGIRGVYSIKDLKSDDDIIEKAEIIPELDEIPFPDWEQMNPNLYSKAPHGAIAKNFPIGVITTTRGCPYRCIFCASPKFYNGIIRYRSPENVVKEIIYLIDNYGVKEIHFEDDNLTFKKEHIEKICNLIIQSGRSISWACPNGVRADRVDVNLIRLMMKSGCYYFAYGIESADPGILKNIKKDVCIETIKRSIEIAEKEGISCQGFFIFGLPGETSETIKKTINFSKKIKLSRAQFLILDIVPGSELWYTLEGKFNPNWNKDSFREPEWIPEGLTKEQLIKAQVRAFRSFYFRLPVLFKLLKLIRPRQIGVLLQRLKEYRILK
ncbi:MAG: radical SAM protein [Candidatus Omnitrophica bacterium]|nr:radical SAM protein [Candidatus Omnitrophota bacterium]